MPEKHISLQLSKWPYYVGQVLMTVIAVTIAVRAEDLSGWTALFCVLSAVIGAALIILPFYLEHRTKLQAYIVDSQTRAAMQRDRFAQWESLFMEQLQRFAALNAQVEQNMLATEGMVRRADRKLQALEFLEDKMDKVLSSVLDQDSSSIQRSSAISHAFLPILTENDMHIAQESSSLIPSTVDVSPLLARGETSGSLSRNINIENTEATFSPQFEEAVSNEYNFFRPSNQGENELANKGILEEEAVIDELEDQDKSHAIFSFNEIRSNGDVQEGLFSMEQNSKEIGSVSSTYKGNRAGSLDLFEEVSVSSELEKALPKPSKKVAKEKITSRKSSAEFSNTENINKVGVEKTTSEKKGVWTELLKKSGKLGESVIVANVMIGLGNKPFIRGSGAGLSWDKGIPMEFVEIGKWSWQVKNEQDLIEFKIFKNDQEADEGLYHLNSGEVVEVAPQFSSSAKNLLKT